MEMKRTPQFPQHSVIELLDQTFIAKCSMQLEWMINRTIGEPIYICSLRKAEREKCCSFNIVITIFTTIHSHVSKQLFTRNLVHGTPLLSAQNSCPHWTFGTVHLKVRRGTVRRLYGRGQVCVLLEDSV